MRLCWFCALVGALIPACTPGHHDAAADTTSSTTLDPGSDTSGPSGPPLPPRPDTIACRFDGTAPGLLPRVAVAAFGDVTVPAIDLVATDGVVYLADEDLRIVALDTEGTELATVVDLADRASRLVALAVASDHAQSGHLYVRYEASTGSPRAVIARLTIDPSTHVAIPDSHRVVMEIDDGVGERSGGALAFGPDELLYIGVGALASESTQALAPDPTSRLGKLLRIDVSTLDTTGSYSTPADNPFVGQGGASDEVWAVGLRDPWRCTFAVGDPRPWCVDVGANEQEIDHVDAHMNLGWPYAEGTACQLPSGDCNDLLIDPPLATYRAADGDCGIAGVVLGSTAELEGALVYVDRCSGRIRGLDTQSEEVLIQDEIIGITDDSPTGIVQDAAGRVLVLSDAGVGELRVEIDDAEFPTTLIASGCFDDITTLTPAPGLVPYGVNAELWTDGAIKDRFLVIPPGATMGVAADGTVEFPIGTVILKLFSFEYVVGDPTTRMPVEGRVMVRRELGWQFHSYRFADDGHDATLLSRGEQQQLVIEDGGQAIAFDYFWPSRGSCKVCHGSPESSALGPRLDQLDRDFDYGKGVANQLDAMTSIGLFSEPLPPVDPMPAPHDTEAPAEQRARAYLHTNCGHCHRPGGWTPPDLTMDLRYGTPLFETSVCDVEIQYFNPSVTSMVRIAPGDPDGSVIWQRINLRGTGQMPPLATSRVDPGGSVVGEWIAGLDGCPQQ